MKSTQISPNAAAERALVVLDSVGARPAAEQDIAPALRGDCLVVWFADGPLHNSGLRYFPNMKAFSNAVDRLRDSEPSVVSIRHLTLGSFALIAAVHEQGGSVLSLAPLRQFTQPGQADFESPYALYASSDETVEEAIAIPSDTFDPEKLAARFLELSGFELGLRPLELQAAPPPDALERIAAEPHIASGRRLPRRVTLAASIAAVAAVFAIFGTGDQKKSDHQADLSALTVPGRDILKSTAGAGTTRDSAAD